MALVIAEVAPEGMLGTQPPVDLDERTQRFHRMLEVDGVAAWVLEDDGQVVGSADVTERTPGVLSLGIAILPEARGRGGGKALLDAVIDHAGHSSAHKLDLEVWTDNLRAISLYGSAGFQVEGLRRDHYRRADGTLRSTLLMALPLVRS